ncbi:hypothetical protein [Jatrophihabitans sp.]|jgi:hypothetical protein|uniref:hypothetical protein n=1 Tax=Jatrophihabitans sp. TaxID=1932789 RepID=UPI002EDC4B9F
METDTAPDPDTGPQRAARPRSVDLAVGAILLRCVLALAAAFALFGAKPELRRNAATLHPEWSVATLADEVDSQLRSNVVLTVVYIGLILLVAKYIRDGRSWARWLYLFVAVLVAADVFRVAGFFTDDNLLFRLLSGFTGLASLVAIVLLFLPSSAAYFRPARASASPLGALFGGRAAMAATRGAADRTAARGPAPAGEPSGGEPVSLTKASERSAVARPTAAKRPAPRAKSRKQAPQ